MVLQWWKPFRSLACSLTASRFLFHIQSGRGKLTSSSQRLYFGTKGLRKWNPLTWYNEMLEKHPIRTKCITSGVLFAMGDFIAQKTAAGKNRSLDDKRLLRAIIYGSGTAPLAHVHFNFLEWLVVRKIAFRASFVPFVKMFIDQFGYWAPCITAVYHVSMGVMEGLTYNETMYRLKTLYWPTLKACWMIWPAVMIVNFRFIPVAHQLNFCLAVSLVWATILSVIRASEASHVKEIESIDTISITNYSVEATQQ
ncbi:hypothetical protein ABFA07_016985 [Porites harrisoni]